jgi:ABC-type nitrate/sulfonate/bicarbonate transport system substrate-binding protein
MKVRTHVHGNEGSTRRSMIAATIALLLPLGATAAAAEPAPTPAPLKVRIGYPTALHGEIAKVLGKTDIGKKHGLDVETTFFQYGPPQIEALISKTLDVSFTSLVPTSTYLAKQPGAVTVIAALGASAHGLVVPGDSPLKTLTDFKGKSIAVAFGTDSQVDLLAALKAAGLAAGDVKVINVPPNEQPAALEQKLADGVLLRQPQLYKFLQKGAREIKRWPHHLWVIARTDFLASSPDARRRVTEAIQEAAVFVGSNPRQAATWFAEDLRLDAGLVQKIAEQNPLFATTKDAKTLSVKVSPELQAFASKRAEELVEFGLAKQVARFTF